MFDSSHYGLRSFGTASSVGGSAASVTQAEVHRAEQRPSASWKTARVLAAAEGDLHRLSEDLGWGISEKANGVRCVLDRPDGGEVLAYNRRSQLMGGGAPGCAVDLRRLAPAFRLDGEWISGGDGEQFVAFDLMSLLGQDLTDRPYEERIERLLSAARAAGLALDGGPTLADAAAATATRGFVVLTAETDPEAFRKVASSVRAGGGEGVVLRRMAARYQEGDTREILKVKYTATIDVFGVRVEPGTGGGSLVMGLVRPSDGAVVEVGQVRSGLNAADMAKLAAMVSAGQRPVFEVEYLAARTVGVKLVEARTSMRSLRDDKLAEECTTEQLGPDRQHLVAAA